MDKKWIGKPSPKSMHKGTGWFAELNKAYTYNMEYAAMTRELDTKWGKIIHCAVRNAKGTEISWKDKQWIKDSLFGKDRVAIEIFPAENRLVDAANMYHLWVFPKDFEMPFGIHDDDVSERSKDES